MLPSIRHRLLLFLLPASLAIWLAAAFFSYLDSQRQLSATLDHNLARAANLLLQWSKNSVPQPAGSDISDSVQEPWALLKHLDDGRDQPWMLQVWRDEVLVVRTENAPRGPLSSKDEGFVTHLLQGRAWRIYAAKQGRLRVLLGQPAELHEDFRAALRRPALTALLLGLPLMALLIWYATNAGLQPLNRLAEEMRRRRPLDLHAVDDYAVPVEARPLIDALNNLFDHLQNAFDTERRFTADAAHELRTPLAALKTHAEVALAAENEEQQRQALRQLVRGVNRATRLVEQLLTLARLDPDTGLTNTRRFDLFISAETVISDEALLALEKDIEISLSGTRGKFVVANPDAIAVLMRNLINNAIRYTPAGGVIDVRIERRGDDIVFSVCDSGDGIPEDERERVLQRFYRRLGTKSPGSGLGLSIVTRIAELHELSLSLGQADLGGLQVDVVFAAADGDNNGAD